MLIALKRKKKRLYLFLQNKNCKYLNSKHVRSLCKYLFEAKWHTEICVCFYPLSEYITFIH